jgi:hypothetical protein
MPGGGIVMDCGRRAAVMLALLIPELLRTGPGGAALEPEFGFSRSDTSFFSDVAELSGFAWSSPLSGLSGLADLSDSSVAIFAPYARWAEIAIVNDPRPGLRRNITN